MNETSSIIRRYLHRSVATRSAGPRSGSVTRTAPPTMQPGRARCRASDTDPTRKAALVELSPLDRHAPSDLTPGITC